MKKTLLFLLVLLVTSGLQAHNDKSKGGLTGIWQQIQVAKTDGHIIKLPVWKILQQDGSFCTFLIANKEGQSIITNEGTYKVTSDSTYVEHIKNSITAPELINRSNTITYSMPEKDKLVITYRMPEAKEDASETWIRVKVEYPR